ncbi:MAG: EAL domain-containing protein [Gammaproteobacteria bacterium]|nr:EAL domain-containing protein [Gammaproteobacteria bacterium]
MEFHPAQTGQVVSITRDKATPRQFDDILRNALQHGQLALHFQPIVKPNGNIIGAESKLRWLEPRPHKHQPARLLETIDDAELISEIARWELTQACALIATVAAARPQNDFQFVSVAIDSRYFEQSDFAEDVLGLIQNAAIDPARLRCEIKEDVAVRDIAATIEKLQKLQDAGISCQMGQFGTGYASLTHLHRLPLTAIKIDRLLISHINEHPQHQSLVDASVAMAQYMDKDCIIDGVESHDDLLYFQDVGIDAMQGGAFPEANDARSFVELLENGSLFDFREYAQQTPLYQVAGI